jgi:hypothetical protein
MNNLKARLLVLLISGILLSACLFFALPAVFTDTSRWRETEGTVVHSSLSAGSRLKRKLRVQYEYQVEGRTYRSRRATLWSESVPGIALRGSEQAWPKGTPVRVYHHPTDHARAVLDPTVSTPHKVATVFATVVSGLGVLGACTGSVVRRR